MAVVINVYGKADLKQIANAEKQLGSMKREVVAQQPAWKRLGSTISSTGAKIASSLAAAGIVRWLAGSVKVAEAAEVINTKLRTVVQAATKGSWAWGSYEASMQKVVDKQSQLSAYGGVVLKGALATLTQTTGSASKGLDLLGLSTDLARGKSMDLNKAALLVGKVAMGNTTALSRYGIVLKKGSTIQENLAALQTRFAGQAKAYGDTSAGAQEKFGNALRQLQLTVGTALMPSLIALSGWLVTLLTKFQSLPGPVRTIIIGVAALAGAAALLAPFYSAIIGIGKAMQLAALASKAWAAVQWLLSAAMSAFRGLCLGTRIELAGLWIAEQAQAVASKVAAAGQWLLNAAMSANPISIIIIAIVALVAIFVVLWTKCDWFRNFWIAVWDQVKAVAEAVWPAIKTVGEKIVAALQWTWDTLSAAVTWFWGWAGPFITAGIQLWWSVIKTTFTTIINVVTVAWNAIVAVVRWFWDWAGPFISAGARTWWTIISTTFTTIIDVVRTAWNTIKNVVQAQIDVIIAVIHTIEAVVGFVRGIWDRVHEAAITVWNVITGAVRSAIGDVVAAIHAVDAIVAFVRGVFNDINSVASNVGDKIAATVGDIWRGIKSVAKNVWDDIVGVVKDAWNNIKGFANDIIDVINHVVKVVPGLGNNVPGYPFPSFAVGGAANGPSTGYPVIMHGRETVVAHDNPTRGLVDLVSSGILGGGRAVPSAPNAPALTFETRGPHVGADGDSGGRSILGSIGSVLGSAAGWVGDLLSKFNIFSMLPKPVGGLFGGATNAILDMVKNAIVGLLEKFGLGDRQKIVNFAKSQLGMPYVWGGASPAAGGFDCSGLMQWAYRQAGHNVQWRVPTYGGRQISRGAIQPADIMFYYPNSVQNGVRVPFGHFKMYADDDQTIESTSGGVQMRPADWAGAAQIRTYLAMGGYVPRTAGGLAAVLGDGNEGEYVVPESKVGRFASAALAGSGGVYIAPGAVVVKIGDVNGASAAEVESAARSGVEPALARLAIELQHL